MGKLKQALPEGYDATRERLNQIFIIEPRWHDRVVLIADRRLMNENEIIIGHKDFPTGFYITGERAREFPLMQMKTKSGHTIAVREVPLSELEKEVIDV